MRRLEGITNSMYMSLSELRELVMDQLSQLSSHTFLLEEKKQSTLDSCCRKFIQNSLWWSAFTKVEQLISGRTGDLHPGLSDSKAFAVFTALAEEESYIETDSS